ncbi:MAG: DNA topoisomerase 3 [Prevotella sp.]|nr:DNA topoisomerase 3 [Prevotella sp.]
MIVCIAEKPSVARDIAHVIGATQAKQGYIEGNGYQVTWTYGHLCTLKEPNDYSEQWKHWALSALPMIPQRFGIKLIDEEHITKQFAVVEKLMKNADSIINCGDAGQEGELIQRWVMQKAGARCPVKRLWISSLTEDSIREGFANLKDQKEYESLYLAGLSRAIGDWLLGMNATRLYTIKYGQNRQVLSVGRVQTPTLALIVNRQREIENFVPRQSWVLSTIYRDTKFTAIARDEDAEAEEAAEIQKAAEQGKTMKSKGPIYRTIEYATEEEGLRMLEAIKNEPLRIISITKKKGSEAPPKLYDLTSLQVECNKKFSYSADMTLKTVQSLYEKKFTTYPRVDTTYLSDDIYPKCPATLNGLFKTTFAGQAVYADLVKPLGGKPLKKSRKVFDSSKVTDHHAIIPTGVPPQYLTDAERNVFDLIARAFIAVFYDDCKFETTTVMGESGREGGECVTFRTSGKVITDEGWRVVFKENGKVKAGKDEAMLPVFVKGEQGPHDPVLSEKWTQPPKPYTEATLLRAMETAGRFVEDETLRAALKENGIGRPSSRAGIIETLFKRKYIRRERKNLVATPTGIDLIDIIHEELLKSCELTGIWEKKLRDIEHHKYDAAQFIAELKQQAYDIVMQVLNDNSNRRISISEENGKLKTESGKEKVERRKPKKKASKDNPVKEGDTCPACGQGVVIRGKTALGCSRWKEGCTFRQKLD